MAHYKFYIVLYCIVFCQYCLIATYELTRTSHNCGQWSPSVHINFNAAS